MKTGGGVTKKKKTEWNPRMEFDVISVGDGSVLSKDYGDPRRYVVTRGNESPRDVARKREQEERAKRGAGDRAGTDPRDDAV
jgi:hypothetical protein